MATNRSILYFFYVLTFVIETLPQNSPKAILYTSRECTGDFIYLSSYHYTANLSRFEFDNIAQSVAVVGTWLFYDLTNFNTNGDAAMEHIFEPSQTCVNFVALRNRVSSARFVGSPLNYNTSTITFYSTPYFQGEEEYVLTNLPNLQLFGKQASLIVTGSSNWMLYDRPYYNGSSMCIGRDTDDKSIPPIFIHDTVFLNPTVKHGSIASIKQGCTVTTLKFFSLQLTHYKEIVYNDVASLKSAGLLLKKNTAFLVHGFNGNSTQDYNICRVVGRAYLKENDFPNVICVDYGKLTRFTGLDLIPNMSPIQILSYAFYPKVVRNMKIVGKRISEFIQFLIENGYGPTSDSFHLIGHSLGAHICGIAGLYINKDTSMLIGRITGLDPAGVLTVVLPIVSKQYILSPSHAKFVEVIHSNSEFFGTTKSLGTVDWWANGGRGIDQPGCADCLKYFFGLTVLSCGHNTAITYFAKSMTQDFRGCKCKREIDQHLSTTCKPINPRGCSKKRIATFGDTAVRGNYYLSIPPNKTSPPPANIILACLV